MNARRFRGLTGIRPFSRLGAIFFGICLSAMASPSLHAAEKTKPTAQETLELSARTLSLPKGSTAVELQMRGTWYASEQAREPALAFSEIDTLQSVLVAGDGRYRVRTHTNAPGAPELRFMTIGAPSGAATIDEMRWNRGIEIQRAAAEAAREEYADLLLLAPALLLRDAQARGAVTPADADASGKTQARFTDAAGRPITLAIDAATGHVSSAVLPNGRFDYDDYRSMQGMMQPAHVVQFAGDRKLADWRIAAAAAPAAIAADAFQLPQGYVEKTDRGPLRATALGEGTYRVDGAPADYHTGFVVGEEGIAVFDAPLSPEIAGNIKALIERTAPGRRIAYVVISHPHGDHAAGLPAYLQEGVQVVAGANAGVALRRQLGDKAPPRLIEASQKRVFDLGKRTIEVYPLDSAHSSAMLVGYAPESRTVFQGDLFFIPEVGPASPASEGKGSAELARLIADRGLRVVRIIGVHGRSAGAEDVAAMLKTPAAEAKPE